MLLQVISFAEIAFSLAVSILLIGFAIWAYRKANLRSVPWVLAYLVLNAVSGVVFFAFVKPRISGAHYSSGTHFMTYILTKDAWSKVTLFLLAILVLAECVVLINRAGGHLTGKSAAFWRWVYQNSTIIGAIIVASEVLSIGYSLAVGRLIH